MSYYPLFLDIKGAPVLVVGGGKVAERKVKPLVEAGAFVTLVSPRVTPGLKKLIAKGMVTHRARKFADGDIVGARLVLAASGSRDVNKRTAEAARKTGAPVNVADDPKLSSFIVPAVVKRGSLQIAVSTSGKSPFFAKYLRERMEETYGPEYEAFVDLLGAIRNNLLKKKGKSAKNKKIYRALLGSSIPEWLRTGSWSEIDRYLSGLLGKGFTAANLLSFREKKAGKEKLRNL